MRAAGALIGSAFRANLKVGELYDDLTRRGHDVMTKMRGEDVVAEEDEPFFHEPFMPEPVRRIDAFGGRTSTKPATAKKPAASKKSGAPKNASHAKHAEAAMTSATRAAGAKKPAKAAKAATKKSAAKKATAKVGGKRTTSA
jgi:hypothetical protein